MEAKRRREAIKSKKLKNAHKTSTEEDEEENVDEEEEEEGMP